MTMSEIEKSNRFIEVALGLAVRLRSGDGLDEQEFEAALNQLKDLATLLHGSEFIYKPLASVLFDLSTALYSAADAYPDSARSYFYKRFDEFCDVARDVLN